MFTVYRQGAGRGIGMGYDEFVVNFEGICAEHVEDSRARAFAFVFYNMIDGVVRKALASESGFKILNQASGHDITLFYLHGDAKAPQTKAFNEHFFRALNIDVEQASPPCIVFFRVCEQKIDDILIRQIDIETKEPYAVVEEMRRYVADYIERMNKEGNLSGITWIPKLLFGKALKGALDMLHGR
ncbi:hypothetical protein [Burkholderia gladioli]|uniref:hypothetical protein n=1 Tax=Burkholderia gladioli TaxID=28095 RepID=UPI001FC8B366|nr:hypothetical protein [Burkholderia gladioli]